MGVGGCFKSTMNFSIFDKDFLKYIGVSRIINQTGF